MINDRNEEILKLLRKYKVKHASIGVGFCIDHVEFFPEAANDSEELEKKPRADEKVNEATGLTRSQTRDILNMDE